MKRIFVAFPILISALLTVCCSGINGTESVKTYTNPVIDRDAPDPTVIRGKDGAFYAYATWRDRNVPVYKSTDMINWEYVGGAFEQGKVPMYVKGGAIWAPDINYIEGQYVLYFSMSTWGGEWEACIGRAVSDSPTGPFHSDKMLIRSREIGVKNSIDPVVFQEDGRKFLAWGSFSGIYLTELTEDGLDIIDKRDIMRIAGSAYEGTYIHKHKGYYYLFASVGACCEGEKSTYQTVVGRSKSIYGPYVDKQGRKMLDNHHEVLLSGNDKVKGPGHDSQIITDDKGQDWMYYHGYDMSSIKAGRKMFLEQVRWVDGWPVLGEGGHPSVTATAPYVKQR